jgi:hypothetical protein
MVISGGSSNTIVDFAIPAGLRNFTDFLVEIAQAGAAADPRLNDQERALLRRHAEMLAHAVAALERLINQQPAHAQEHYLRTLWQALGSASTIARYQAENPAETRKVRQASECGVTGTRKRTRDHEEVIAAILQPILQEDRNRETGEIVDTVFVAKVNEKLKTRGRRGREPLERDTIVRYVNKLRMNARLSD